MIVREADIVVAGGGPVGVSLALPIARDEILAQADRNRARMRERDPVRRRALLAELQALTADPVRCKEYLLRTSMIEGLRRAATVA
jgi:hypothetical protein